MKKYDKVASTVSETVKAHLLELGCKEVINKTSFHVWEVSLNTEAGLLKLSVSDSELVDNKKDSLVMVHGRFEKPENFDPQLCEYNHINRHSGKWNNYISLDNAQESLYNLMKYFSRMIIILNSN
jgi:hypothetical protein